MMALISPPIAPAAPAAPAKLPKGPLHRAPMGSIIKEGSPRMLLDLLKDLKRKVQSAFSRTRKDPDAPFAMVGAPLKPSPPLNRSSIAVEPER
jgi:hypothetical protein